MFHNSEYKKSRKRIMISMFVLGQNNITLSSEEFKLKLKDEHLKCVEVVNNQIHC